MKNPERVAELLAELRELADNDFELHRIDVLEQDLTAPPQVEALDDNHQRFNGIVYKKDRYGHYSARGGVHRAVYQYYYGDIPNGYHIHHVDEDKNNNAISNLQCLTASDHRVLHNVSRGEAIFVCKICGKTYKARDTGRNKYCSQACADKDHYLERPLFIKTCPVCNKQFQSRYDDANYCSVSCSKLALYAEHHEQKQCVICGKIFSKLKSKPCNTCSPECKNKLISQTKQGKTNRITKICPICGKEFQTPPSQNHKTCSKECGYKFKGLAQRKS